MPEGPEIYAMAVDCYHFFKKNRLNEIIINSGKYRRKPFIGYKLLDKILPSKILSVSTYGKILMIELKHNYYIVITFGMSGYLTHDDIKHNHITFVTKKNNLYYNDHRNFGNIYVLSSDILDNKLSKLGPDMLSTTITFEIFKDQLNKYPNKIIALVLIDQRCICGFGNYLRAEILWYSRINPFRKIRDLTYLELKKIYHYGYNLIRYYASIQIYAKDRNRNRNLDYKLKFKADNYDRTFIVYGQEYDIFGNKIKRDKLDGRSIYWSPKYQN
jgi:formamidopyrimidine-DNA glycosylase